MDRLIDLALGAGFSVDFLPLHGHSGLLLPGNHILIDSRKSAMTQRVALAHELGHIHHGHDWRYPHDRQRDEYQADVFAASLLISSRDYAVAEVMFDTPAAIASELGVPLRILKLWCERYTPTLTELYSH
ncbi:ImmA/IrrE family metallo-endopeptidase [Timonella senegalensis]|uniref:ImmA/IrrE family metallo-endopeptidase n=2 Tax=Timonella senegalensis TaxID=1465825 RepID=UPI002FDE4B21